MRRNAIGRNWSRVDPIRAGICCARPSLAAFGFVYHSREEVLELPLAERLLRIETLPIHDRRGYAIL